MDENIYLMRLRSFKRGKKIQLFYLNQIVIPFEGIARENTGMTFKLVLFLPKSDGEKDANGPH